MSFFDPCVAVVAIQQQLNAADIAYAPCTSAEYVMELEFNAMDWWALLNQFQFGGDVYLMFFVVIGLMTAAEGAFLYGVNRLVTRVKRPPPFRFMAMVRVVVPSALRGTLLAASPVMLLCSLVYLWGFWGASQSDEPRGHRLELWESTWQVGMGSAAPLQSRLGVILVMSGALFVWSAATALIPLPSPPAGRAGPRGGSGKQQSAEFSYTADGGESGAEDDVPEGGALPPTHLSRGIDGPAGQDVVLWRRCTFVLLVLCVVLLLLGTLEFSYSSTFARQVYYAAAGYKVVQRIADRYLSDRLRDALLNVPLVAAMAVVEGLITLGAPSFVEFVLSHFLMTSLTIVESLYVDPFTRFIQSCARSIWHHVRAAGHGAATCLLHCRRRRAPQRVPSPQAADEPVGATSAELLAKAVRMAEFSEAEESSGGAAGGTGSDARALTQFMLGHSVSNISFLLLPFLVMYLVIFNRATQVPSLYQIKETDLIYYLMFTIVIVPALLVLDIFKLCTIEMMHGVDVYTYASFQNWRFANRSQRWTLSAARGDALLFDHLQRLDLMCFSSQYYFIVSCATLGLLLIVFGANQFLRHRFNPFGDPALLPICCSTMLVLTLLKRLLVAGALRTSLWRPARLHVDVLSSDAGVLGLGTGEREDVQRKRLEQRVMEQAEFRMRFLQKNRCWLVENLVLLFPGDAVKEPGPLGQTAEQYLTAMYHQLRRMERAGRAAGDRVDISSDEAADTDGEELHARHRGWRAAATSAVTGIARLWLWKARRRRVLRVVADRMLQQRRTTHCEDCGAQHGRPQARGGVVSVQAQLLDPAGTPCGHAIDRLIALFDQAQSTDVSAVGFSADAWRALVLKHGLTASLCAACTRSRQRRALVRRSEQSTPPARPTRPEDMSSDSASSDDVALPEPMLVIANSVPARIMAKWLAAARARLGGMFPRASAHDEVVQYMQRVHEQQLDRPMAPSRPPRRQRRRRADHGMVVRAFPVRIDVSASTARIAQHWLDMARMHFVQRLQQQLPKQQAALRKLLTRTMATKRQFSSRPQGALAADQLQLGHRLARQGDALLREREQALRALEANCNSLSDTHATRRELAMDAAADAVRAAHAAATRTRQSVRAQLEAELELLVRERDDALAAHERAMQSAGDPVERRELDVYWRRRLHVLDGRVAARQAKSASAVEQAHTAALLEAERVRRMHEAADARAERELAAQLFGARRRYALEQLPLEAAWRHEASRWCATATRRLSMWEAQLEEWRHNRRSRASVPMASWLEGSGSGRGDESDHGDEPEVHRPNAR